MLVGATGSISAKDSIESLRKNAQLEARLERAPKTLVNKNGIPENRGVIIASGQSAVTCETPSLIYRILRDNGYDSSEIFVLDFDGIETMLYPSDGKATSENIHKVMAHLKRMSGPEDGLFVYVASLMTRDEKGKSALGMTQDDKYSVGDLMERLSNIKGSGLVFIDAENPGPAIRTEAVKEKVDLTKYTFIAPSRENSNSQAVTTLLELYALKKAGYVQKNRNPTVETMTDLYREIVGFRSKEHPFEVISEREIGGKQIFIAKPD